MVTRMQNGLTSLALLLLGSMPALADDAERGRERIRPCLACHSIVPGEHLTGPSLHGIWARQAGTTPGYGRYSPALRASNLRWDEKTLDAWLADPAKLVPGNWMAFPGLRDAAARREIAAFLRTLAGESPAMGKPRLPDLKKAPPDSIVESIRHCGDAYRVRTGDGEEVVIWEFNLRIKTDSSRHGPRKGEPVLLASGMRGDRASVVFSDPTEISPFIKKECLN